MKHLGLRTSFRRPFAATRRGAIIILAAALMVMIMAFAAFTLDVGWIALTKGQLQGAADAAALSAATELNPMGNQSQVAKAVRDAAADVAARHRGGEQESIDIDPQRDVTLGRRSWNPETKKYTYEWGSGATPYNIVKVKVNRAKVQVPGDDNDDGMQVRDRRLPLFFAPILGQDKASLYTEAVATFLPRDMMLVLDYSASMNDDSALTAYNKLGREAVDENIRQIWEDLSSPEYGRLPFEPDWATLSGQPASGAIPHIDVTYMGQEVEVASTKDLSNVVLEFADGNRQKFDGLNGQRKKFKGTGSNNKEMIVTAWVKSGGNGSGDDSGYGERFDFNLHTIKNALGLGSYPYAAGNWDEFIASAMLNGSTQDRDFWDKFFAPTGKNINYWARFYNAGNVSAGYTLKFGAKNLIDYWNLHRPMHHESADLWKTRQQPVTALKDAADLFLDYLIEVKADDQVGLSIYTYPDSTGAILEKGLTYDYSAIKTLYRQRQAGHYDHYTHISAGMKVARQELEQNARGKAVRTMILMTDGQPMDDRIPQSTLRGWTIDEAYLAKEAGIKITTISLGTGADRDLMQQVADITEGKHFNVPGGRSVAEMEEQLKEVFAEIAADRPIKLISPAAAQ